MSSDTESRSFSNKLSGAFGALEAKKQLFEGESVWGILEGSIEQLRNLMESPDALERATAREQHDRVIKALDRRDAA